jgi:hypothetical protein
MKFEIKPYVGAGVLRLGLKEEEIRELLQFKPEKIDKTSSDILTDVFPMCHVFYKNDGSCEAIEFFEPAKVVFNGVSLICADYDEIKRHFEKLDTSIEEDESGFISFENGISIYSPFLEKVEGVLIFERGYYD